MTLTSLKRGKKNHSKEVVGVFSAAGHKLSKRGDVSEGIRPGGGNGF